MTHLQPHCADAILAAVLLVSEEARVRRPMDFACIVVEHSLPLLTLVVR
jgi:hypothetical protein